MISHAVEGGVVKIPLAQHAVNVLDGIELRACAGSDSRCTVAGGVRQ